MASLKSVTEKPTKPNCWQCAHRGEVPGSAHSSCQHPATRNPIDENPLSALVGIMGRRSGLTNLPSRAAIELKIVGAEQGIRRGWFLWPVNFDPTWLEHCDGFEAKVAVLAKAEGGAA